MSIFDEYLKGTPLFEPVRLGHDERGQPIELTFDHFYRHMHFLGLSRRGKSRALVHVLEQLLLNRSGFTLIDPDGEIYGPLISWLARQDQEFFEDRTIHLFNPSDPEFAPSYNPLRVRDGEIVEDRVYSFMDAVSSMYGGEQTAVMQLYQMIFRSMMSPLAAKGLTPCEALLALPRDEEALRDYLVGGLTNWVDEQVWKEIAGWNDRLYQENIGSTMRRIVNMVHHPVIQHVFGQTENNLDVFEVMEQGQFVLVNLRGLRPPVPEIIGRALVNDYVQTARIRRVPGEARPHIMVIDECAPFLSDDIVTGLDRTSKVGLHFVLSHQRIGQLVEQGSENIRDGVMAGAQTKVLFGTNYDTAKTLVDDVFAAHYDTERLKENVRQPMVTGYKPVIRRGGSAGTSQSEGRTETQSTATAKSQEATTTAGVAEASGVSLGVTETDGLTLGHSTSSGVGGGSSKTRSWQEGVSESTVDSVSTSQSETGGTGTSTASTYGDPGLLPADPDSVTETESQNQASTHGESRTSTTGRTETSARGESETEQSTWSESETNSFALSFQRALSYAASFVQSRSLGVGIGEGKTVTQGKSVGVERGTSTTDTSSWQESKEPVIEWIATQTYTLEEERHRYTRMLVEQGVRRFILKDPIVDPLKQVRIGTTETVELLEVEPSALRDFTRQLYLSSGINTPTYLVDEARRERHLKLRQAAGPQIIPPTKRPQRARIEHQPQAIEDEDDPYRWLSARKT